MATAAMFLACCPLRSCQIDGQFIQHQPTDNLFEFLPGMWLELLISKGKVVAIHVCQWEWILFLSGCFVFETWSSIASPSFAHGERVCQPLRTISASKLSDSGAKLKCGCKPNVCKETLEWGRGKYGHGRSSLQ